jgi:hypothetical protein
MRLQDSGRGDDPGCYNSAMRLSLSSVRHAPKRALRAARLGPMFPYVRRAAQIPGWTRGTEADALALANRSLKGDAVVVEIGAFMGSATVVLAGARKLAGTGMVHCVDPFDGSGDSFSVPVYAQMEADLGMNARQRFDQSISDAGVADFVTVHHGTAESIAPTWDLPIDVLFMDGDQSPTGARSAFDLWEPWLRTGGLVVLTNSAPRHFDDDHDGQFRVADQLVVAPWYENRRVIGTSTFAERALPRRTPT